MPTASSATGTHGSNQRHEASQLQQSGATLQHTSIPTQSSKFGAKNGLRPRRSVRRPVTYTQFFVSLDADPGEERGDYKAWQSTDSEAEEDARIGRSMGVIRKNAASRGSDGGTKYHCDV